MTFQQNFILTTSRSATHTKHCFTQVHKLSRLRA